MLTWLANNFSTIVICLVLALLFFFAIRHVVRTHKNGGCSGCSGGECPHCSSHQQQK